MPRRHLARASRASPPTRGGRARARDCARVPPRKPVRHCRNALRRIGVPAVKELHLGAHEVDLRNGWIDLGGLLGKLRSLRERALRIVCPAADGQTRPGKGQAGTRSGETGIQDDGPFEVRLSHAVVFRSQPAVTLSTAQEFVVGRDALGGAASFEDMLGQHQPDRERARCSPRLRPGSGKAGWSPRQSIPPKAFDHAWLPAGEH